MGKERNQAEIEAKRIAALNDTTNANKKAAIEALRKTLGNVSKACEAVNISRTQFYEWVNEDADFAQSLKDIREKTVDIAETALQKLIQEGNPTAIIFYLKTQAKDRGYREGMEHTGADGKDLFPQFANQPIQVEIIKTTNE